MPRKPDMPCAECGTLMWRGTGVLPEGQATCRPCRNKRPAARSTANKGALVTVWDCAACGKRCERKPARGQIPKWCEDCRSGGSKKKIECAHCGVTAWTWHGGRYCSRPCFTASTRRCRDLVHVGSPDFCWLPASHPVIRWADRLQARSAPAARYWGAIASGPCAWCEETFTALSGTARYCSSRCSRNATRAARGKRFQIPPKARLAIYIRDAWTCQLCGERVDQDLMATDPYQDWAPSLDHVVPQSKGGGHDASNLRLAHRWCNAVRGAEDYHADLFAVA